MNFHKYVACLGLALTILLPFLHLFGMLASFETTKYAMVAGMIVWFIAASPWLALEKEELDTSTQDQN